MPDQYVAAVRELIEAKLEQRAPEIAVAPEGKAAIAVINTWTLLKRACRRKAAPRFVMRCGNGRGSGRSKKRPDRHRPAADQVRVEPRSKPISLYSPSAAHHVLNRQSLSERN